MSKSVTWKISKRDTFNESVKKLEKPLRRKLGVVMDMLIASQYPNRYGEKKITKYGEVRTIDLNTSVRLTYEVDFVNRIITVIRVGPHKKAYGKG